MSVKIGEKAPDFELTNQSGIKIRFFDMIGTENIVLFFYPMDSSPGCTAQACAFRDSYEVFQDYGAEVIGISSGDQKSHFNFVEKNKLPYTLLSDTGRKVRKLYGVPKTMGFIDGRVTYVIDKQGIIRHIFNSQLNFSGHVEEALSILKSINENSSL